MKKLLLYSVFLCLDQAIFSQSTVSYNAFFDYTKGYCPGDSQYDHWVDFITSLDTGTNKYLKLTMRGSYDMTGKTCSDKYAVRRIAHALSNGYDATVYCDGDNWSVGTGCSDFNCGSYSDYIELTLNNYTCNCGVSYTVRPCSNSPNWGGIGTETCQAWYGSASQYMMVDMERINGIDNLSLSSMVPFDECLNTQSVTANVENVGTNTVGNYTLAFTINGVLQTPVAVTSPLGSDGLYRVTLLSSYTFVPNTTYAFKVWTYNPNNNTDSDRSNDTLSFKYTHTGVPGTPKANPVVNCGQGTVNIHLTTNDSIAWFDAPTGGTLLGIGKSFTTPYLYSSDTFYAESVNFLRKPTFFGTGFNNYTTLSNNQGEYNGGMVVLNVKDVIHISGIKVQSVFGNSSPHYKVYLREGGFAGYERDSTAWTRIFDGELPTASIYNIIPVQLVLKPGKDYGLYITTDPLNGEDVWINYGAYAYNNPDLTVEGGAAVYGKFGAKGIYTPWTIDMEFIYEKTCRSSVREPVPVTVKPRPSGAELVAGKGFSGQYNPGFESSPDIGEMDIKLNYELTNPSGYTNSEYGTRWQVDDVSLLTVDGYPVKPSMFSFTNPDSTGKGQLFFTPDSSMLDSTIVIRIRYSDLGPFFCDTIITRFIHVAPTPHPNFRTIASICEGSEVYFHNLSTVHSGKLTYKWFFSKTDSSDIFEPIHKFDSFGIYPVKLVVTSQPYGVSKDTTIIVNINGIPKVDFKIINACQGQSVVFNNLTPGNKNLISFKWDFGDRTPYSTATDPVHKYAVPDGYKVTLTADLNGCIGVVTKNAFLFSKPVVDFIAPVGPKCQDENIFFLNNSYIYQGKMGAYWDFKDGDYSTFFNAGHRFPAPGIYDVKLKMVSEFDCTDSLTRMVTIKPAPIVNFSADKLCSRDSTRFTNLSSEYPGIMSYYTWTFSEGPKQTEKNVSKKWNGHGAKTVKLRSLMSNGCAAETEQAFNVLIQPQADFRTSDICSGDTASFVNLSLIDQGFMDFVWDFGDSSALSAIHNPRHRYQVAKTTNYTVTLVAHTTDGCPSTFKKTIKVNEVPFCNFTFAPFTLVGSRAFKFTPQFGNYTEYEWFFGDGGTSKTKSPIYQFLYGGIYNIELRAKNSGGCECRQIIKLNVNLTGIEDAYTDVFNIYPNPANESVTIVLAGVDKGIAHIYNQLGQLVQSVDLSENTKIMTDGLSSGLYVVEVLAGYRRAKARISIIH